MLGYRAVGWQDILFDEFTGHAAFSSLTLLFLITFLVGSLGLIWRAENLLMVLAFGELLLVSLVFGFVVVSKYLVAPVGQIYALAILNAAAVESAIGLIIILNLFKTNGSISLVALRCLRG